MNIETAKIPLNIAAEPSPYAVPEAVPPGEPPPATVVTMPAGETEGLGGAAPGGAGDAK